MVFILILYVALSSVVVAGSIQLLGRLAGMAMTVVAGVCREGRKCLLCLTQNIERKRSKQQCNVWCRSNPEYII